MNKLVSELLSCFKAEPDWEIVELGSWDLSLDQHVQFRAMGSEGDEGQEQSLIMLQIYLNCCVPGCEPVLGADFPGAASTCAEVRIVLWGQGGPLCPSGRGTNPSKSHLLCLSYPDFPVVHWKPRPIYEEEKSGLHRDPANESTSQGRKSQKKGKFFLLLCCRRQWSLLQLVPLLLLYSSSVWGRWGSAAGLNVGTALWHLRRSEVFVWRGDP